MALAIYVFIFALILFYFVANFYHAPGPVGRTVLIPLLKSAMPNYLTSRCTYTCSSKCNKIFWRFD